MAAKVRAGQITAVLVRPNVRAGQITATVVPSATIANVRAGQITAFTTSPSPRVRSGGIWHAGSLKVFKPGIGWVSGTMQIRKGGVWQTNTAPVTSGPSAAFYVDPDPPPTGIPVGMPVLRYIDLVQAGDDLNAVFNRAKALNTPFVFQLPAGTFQLPADFAQPDTACLQLGVGSQCLGLAGAGIDQTFITDVTNGSPARAQQASGTTPWRLLKFSGGTSDTFAKTLMYFGGFTMVGTQQGNTTINGGIDYHMFSLYRPNTDEVRIQDIKFTGGHASGGAPPFETFHTEVQCDPSRLTPTRVRYIRLQSDGRRADGLIYGGVSTQIENCTDAVAWDCKGLYLGAAHGVAYQASNLRYYRCVFGTATEYGLPFASKGAAGTSLGVAFNFEQCTGCKMFDCTYIAKTGVVHVTFSNLVSGTLDIWNPTFNNSITGGTDNGKFHIQSWVDSFYPLSGQTIRPNVFNANGTPFAAWNWRHGAAGEIVFTGP
jgi:hypothetical protein